MRRSRAWVPTRLTGATDNSLARWADLLDVMESHPHLWRGISTEQLLIKTEGRPRMPGQWGLAYLLYANSAERELTRWWRSTTDELWQRVGFVQTPSYQAVYKNFAELEGHEGAFREVAARLIQLAVDRSDGKVGHAVHVDGTEAEAHSRLVHDCRDDELAACKRQTVAPGRVTNGLARAERHKLATDVPSDDEMRGDVKDMAADERGLRVLVGGCWYLLSDAEAGVRAYTTEDGRVRRFWSGYYNIKAVDHYTGAVLAVSVTKASVQEHVAYPALFEQVKDHLGTTPRAVVADRGYSIASVYEMHTREGVASVMPWRKSPFGMQRTDTARYDRHGVPRCRHCQAETTYVNFRHDDGPYKQPRLWFRCARPMHAGCRQVQSITCAHDWRTLVPLWRTSAAYQTLRATHTHYKAAHHRWRERYAVAGDCKADRFKRRGLGVQQLRAAAALIIEWVTVCHREGWLGGVRINDREETRVPQEQVKGYLDSIMRGRLASGLTVIEADAMPAHQREVDAAYGNSKSGLGAGSAYGRDMRQQPDDRDVVMASLVEEQALVLGETGDDSPP